MKENVKKKKKMKKTCRKKKSELDGERFAIIAGAMVLGLPCCKRKKCLEFNC